MLGYWIRREKTFSVSMVVGPGEAEVVAGAPCSGEAGTDSISLLQAEEGLKNRRGQVFAELLASGPYREVPRPNYLLCL